MKGIEGLQTYISDGSLRIVQAVAVPRSVSTALARAINEADGQSVFINEPFNRRVRSPDAAANVILDNVDPLLSIATGSLTVITKSMASYMDHAAFTEMSALSESTIWNVSHPLIQMGSLLTRIANDIAVEPGADLIRQDTLEPYLEGVTDYLAHSEKSDNFSKTGWASIGEHYQNKHLIENSIVVDGEELITNPYIILSGLSARLGLKFNPRMVGGWERGFINISNGDNKQITAESAWTRQAATSIGMAALPRQAIDIVKLPAQLREHITEVAIPVYEAMIADSLGHTTVNPVSNQPKQHFQWQNL
jgi:hypothetical protein